MLIERYLAVSEIAFRLGVSRARAYQVIRECTRIKYGRSVRVPESAFQQWLEEHTISTAEPELPRFATPPPGDWEPTEAWLVNELARLRRRKRKRQIKVVKSGLSRPINPSLPRDGAPTPLPNPNAPPRLRLPIRPSRPRT
jgi:excisionase family DNA binding protein